MIFEPILKMGSESRWSLNFLKPEQKQFTVGLASEKTHLVSGSRIIRNIFWFYPPALVTFIKGIVILFDR